MRHAYINALQLALQQSAPGIVFINEPKRTAGLDSLVARLKEFEAVQVVSFVPASEVADAGLQSALNQTDFTQLRLIAEDGECYQVAISEIKRALEKVQKESKSDL